MKIVFDMAFDSGCWPGPLRQRQAVIGESWVGPLGFMNVLETALGLSGHYPSNTERALRLLGRVRSQSGFWAESAKKDPIGTAQRLLQWRDDLWLAGWRGEARSGRLSQLSALTRDAADGIPDRLEAIRVALRERDVGIDEVHLVEPEEHLSHAWRGILESLRRRQTKVVESAPVSEMEAGGDLAALWAKDIEARGDGTLQLLRPFGVLEAAEQAAAWLRSLPPTWSRVVVWPEPVLDEALQRHGLPTLGARSPLYANALLALLPLTLDLVWEHKDPQVAAELLQLPKNPVHGTIGRKLLGALQAWPAVGSAEWNLALKDALAGIEDPELRSKQAEVLKTFFGSRLPRFEPVPVEEIHKRIRLVADWAHRVLPASPSIRCALEEVVRQCQVLSGMLDAAGLESFTARDIARLLERLSGIVDGTTEPQVGMHAVGEPGAVAGAVDAVLVWDFTLSRFARQSGIPLSERERDELKSQGVDIVSTELLVKREAARWLRPFRMARHAILCVCPRRTADGDEEYPHPAWDEIRARIAKGSGWRLEVARPTLLSDLVLEPRGARHAVAPVATFMVVPGTLRPRPAESASSLDKLLRCPLSYVLEYHGRLRASAVPRLPEPGSNLLRGNVAHELIRIVLEEVRAGRIQTPEQAGERVRVLFDERAPALAAGLFLPGQDELRADLRSRIALIVEDVVGLTRRAGLRIVGVEEPLKRDGLGVCVRGQADLVLGEPVCILDFKWSQGSRRSELENGTALQLAVYGYAVSAPGSPWPAVGFAIIDRRRILCAGTTVPAGAERVSMESIEDTWQALERAFATAWRELSAGHVEASGNLAEEELHPTALANGRLTLEARCEYCSFGALCGNAFGGR